MGINKSLKELGIQDYITLGYLYLVVIGIVNITPISGNVKAIKEIKHN